MRRLGAQCIGTLCLVACAHTPPPADNPLQGVNPDGSPAWVNRGSGAYDGAEGKAFYGVGIVQGIDNPSLSRQTADNRARGEIARLFDTYIAAMMKDYQRSTTAGDFTASAEEQDVVSAQKTITEVTLRGVEIRDHWTDPQTGALYALAVLDLNAIGEALGNANQLSASVRDYVRANARRAFDDLDRELREPQEPAAAPPVEDTAPNDPPPAAEDDLPPVTSDGPPGWAPTQPRRLGLSISGIGRETVQTCFANRLIAAGYKVYENTSDVEVMVSGTLTYKRAGEVNGSKMVKAEANVRAKEMSSGRTLAAVNKRLKVGRPTLAPAIQLAISRICDQVVAEIVAEIKAATTPED